MREPTEYGRAKKFIRQYYRFRSAYRDALELSISMGDGMPRGTGISDPTAQRAANAEKYRNKIRIIEEPLELIPEEYRAGVFNNLVRGMPFPLTASEQTWKNWRQRYVMAVAALLRFSKD